MSVLKLRQVKDENEIKLIGVSVELQQIDTNIEAVVIRDIEGNYIRIVKGESYSNTLKVLVEQPKEYKTYYSLVVKQDDGGILGYEFDSEDEAKRKGESLTNYSGTYEITPVQKEVKKDLQNKVIDDIQF